MLVGLARVQRHKDLKVVEGRRGLGIVICDLDSERTVLVATRYLEGHQSVLHDLDIHCIVRNNRVLPIIGSRHDLSQLIVKHLDVSLGLGQSRSCVHFYKIFKLVSSSKYLRLNGPYARNFSLMLRDSRNSLLYLFSWIAWGVIEVRSLLTLLSLNLKSP